MSAYDIHFEKNKGGNAAGGEEREGGRERRCEKKKDEYGWTKCGGIKGFSTADLVSVLIDLRIGKKSG